MILNIAVSSKTSGSGVRNDMPGFSDISFEHPARNAADMISADNILFISTYITKQS